MKGEDNNTWDEPRMNKIKKNGTSYSYEYDTPKCLSFRLILARLSRFLISYQPCTTAVYWRIAVCYCLLLCPLRIMPQGGVRSSSFERIVIVIIIVYRSIVTCYRYRITETHRIVVEQQYRNLNFRYDIQPPTGNLPMIPTTRLDAHTTWHAALIFSSKETCCVRTSRTRLHIHGAPISHMRLYAERFLEAAMLHCCCCYSFRYHRWWWCFPRCASTFGAV